MNPFSSFETVLVCVPQEWFNGLYSTFISPSSSSTSTLFVQVQGTIYLAVATNVISLTPAVPTYFLSVMLYNESSAVAEKFKFSLVGIASVTL